MKKYKGYYYTTNKREGGYSWTMYNTYRADDVALMEESLDVHETKEEAAMAAEENIDAYYY